MSNSLDNYKDLLEIISDLIVYEDNNKKSVDDYQYEYAYSYTDDYYDYAEKEKPTSIKIDL